MNKPTKFVSKPAKFKSDFAILDVKTGRVALMRRVEKGKKIPVVIYGVIDRVWGNDDGISREFSVEVIGVEEVTERSR